MRIVLKVNEFPSISETFITNKVIGLYERGIEVKVICDYFNKELYYNDENLFKKIPGNLIYERPPYKPFYRVLWSFPLVLLKMLFLYTKKTYKYLCRGWKKYGVHVLKKIYLDSAYIAAKPDIIHFEFGVQGNGKMYLKDLLDTKAIVSFRGFDLAYYGLGDPSVYNDVWEQADAIHILGKHQREKAIERGCPEDREFIIIPPAINEPWIHNSRNRKVKGAINIVSVGRLHWIKGHEYALLAIKHLLDQGICNFHYHIYGEGAMRSSIELFVRQYSLESYVTLHGAKKRDEVQEALKKSDIFLHSAVSEGFCNAVIEAQAMGVPVVCFDVGGLPENIEHGKTGFLVPLRNHEKLGESLTTLVENQEVRMEMSKNGRERVKRKFSQTDQMDKFLSLYKNVSSC